MDTESGIEHPVPEYLKDIITMVCGLRNSMPAEMAIPAMLVRMTSNAQGESVRQTDLFTIVDQTKVDLAEIIKMVLRASTPQQYAFITEGYYLSFDADTLDREDPVIQAYARGELAVSMSPDRKEMIAITYGDGTYEAIAGIDIKDGKVTGSIPTVGRVGPSYGTFSHLYTK